MSQNCIWEYVLRIIERCSLGVYYLRDARSLALLSGLLLREFLSSTPPRLSPLPSLSPSLSLFVETLRARELPHFLWNNSDSSFLRMTWENVFYDKQHLRVWHSAQLFYISYNFTLSSSLYRFAPFSKEFFFFIQGYSFAHSTGSGKCKNQNYSISRSFVIALGPITKISFDLDSTFSFQIFLRI